MNKKKKNNSKTSKNSLELLRVEWLDHWSSNGWQPSEVDITALPIVTVGFKAQETKDMLLLAQNADYQQKPTKGNVMSIIKKCIVSRKKLK